MSNSRILTCTVILTGLLQGMAWSQQTDDRLLSTTTPAAVQATAGGGFAGVAAPATVYRYYGEQHGGHETDVKLHEAVQKYRDAGDDSKARQESRDEISGLLSEKYDLLLKNQEDELEQMEKRLAKLRDQLKQRRDAKQKMVDLKLEMVLAQADGLGWPDNDSDHSVFFPSAPFLPSLNRVRSIESVRGSLKAGSASGGRVAPAQPSPPPQGR